MARNSSSISKLSLIPKIKISSLVVSLTSVLSLSTLEIHHHTQLKMDSLQSRQTYRAGLVSNQEAGLNDGADLGSNLDADNSEGAALKAGDHSSEQARHSDGQNCPGGRAEPLLGDKQNW